MNTWETGRSWGSCLPRLQRISNSAGLLESFRYVPWLRYLSHGRYADAAVSYGKKKGDCC
ncbi:hypothetical protein OAG82_00555 [Rubripirellula sp.]|nr:hypothetical protein [Rubripirellula sp.]MDA7893518.1 hypothetical protein [bacterium]MDB4533027.1 hypothetical protein [bacterium]MDB4621320.1 hypothetical protein [Rubripirellula sp.]MDB4624559.1 hypothetical protein [Rubripirellula sp.]